MLDTDILSYVMKGSSARVDFRLAQVPVDSVCISAVTLSELKFGIVVSPRPQANQAALDALLRMFPVLAYSGEAAEDYAEIRGYLKAHGTPIGPNDLLIAAHARCLGLTLVTNNTREFGRVPGLPIENWTQ
jgi:tRNA(fMet)-specific endonuclease VapC